jgi:hypothetical protein
MPIVSEAQRKAMWAAKEGRSTLGIPKAVAEKFIAHDFASLAANAAIPAGVRKLATDADSAMDMTEEDWRGLLDGLAKFFGEESREPEHATDSALSIALDRDSVREYDRDGRLRVAKTHISKANVCPYRGKEIPGWKELGLDPDQIYNLLRDPEELRKAAPTLNGVPLLRKHIPVNADDHRPSDVVGSLGTDAEFDGEYLDNSLFVNARDAIDGIETNKKRELSAGYHYRPEMTPGNFGGNAYDGVMRDIVFNHVALVEDGRAGPDVVVGDSMENVMAKPTRLGALVLMTTAAHVAPMLAMDSGGVTLPKDLFSKLTTKNFSENKKALLSGVKAAIEGKLRKGLAFDASWQGLAKAVDAFENLENEKGGVDAENPEEAENAEKVGPLDIPQPEKKDFPGKSGSGFDAEPMKAFLREKGMGEDDIAKVCDMMPAEWRKPEGADADETDEEKAARLKKEAASKDDGAKDMVSKPAMDAALKATAEAVTKQVRETERGIRVALHEIKPWVGELAPTLAFDSAEGVYRHALGMLNVDGAKTLHADALLPVLKAQTKPGAKKSEITDGGSSLAMDASAHAKAVKYAPGLEHIENLS